MFNRKSGRIQSGFIYQPAILVLPECNSHFLLRKNTCWSHFPPTSTSIPSSPDIPPISVHHASGHQLQMLKVRNPDLRWSHPTCGISNASWRRWWWKHRILLFFSGKVQFVSGKMTRKIFLSGWTVVLLFLLVWGGGWRCWNLWVLVGSFLS